MSTMLYCRSAKSEPPLDLQVVQARKAGFHIDKVFADKGPAGVVGKFAHRPQGKRLFKTLSRGDVLIVRWIDRLGVNYSDAVEIVRDLMARGVVIKTILGGRTFDGTAADRTTKATRDAELALMATIGTVQIDESEWKQKAGIQKAEDQKRKRETAHLGRQPRYTDRQLKKVIAMEAGGDKIGKIMLETRLSRQTIYRIRKDPEAAKAAIEKWRLARAQKRKDLTIGYR